MDGIESKSIRFCLPAFADEFVGREAMERLESFGEVVGSDEVAEVDTQLVVGVVVVLIPITSKCFTCLRIAFHILTSISKRQVVVKVPI